MEQPGETTTAGSGCHLTYTTPPLTPSPIKYSQEAINTFGISSVGGSLSSTAPPFPTNELPGSGLSYGHGNNWSSTIADSFKDSNNDAAALYQNHVQLNWSTSQLSYAFAPKIPSDQEPHCGHLPGSSCWHHASQDGSDLTPSTVYPTTPFSNHPSTYFSEYPNPASHIETDSVKRRDTFDASYLPPQDALTYSSTGTAAWQQPQLNSNLFPPASPYCHEPHHGLMPIEQPNVDHMIAHGYKHTTTTQEPQPSTATNPPKRRRGRPPKHVVTFPKPEASIPSTASGPLASGMLLSPTVTTISSCSSLDATTSSNPTSTNETPNSSSSPWQQFQPQFHYTAAVQSQNHPGGENDPHTTTTIRRPPPPTRKRSRPSGTSTTTGEDNTTSIIEGGGGDSDDNTNTNLRSRNRQAAIRYRVKSQAAVAQLEAEELEISQRRKSLLASAGELREEVYWLKNEVLKHADCECLLIQAYLAHAARQVYFGLKGPVPPTQSGTMMIGTESGIGGESSGGGDGQGNGQQDDGGDYVEVWEDDTENQGDFQE
ncbi:hypothetical protein B0T21DRAFT_369936 [Apiosordaria backusii]|uniref:BZIP domain-containing protein n=1 Tax=Apiosordaria backusii TaxID=314023 RepID=A0AA40B761_9PEZI|nr:hypothetical protein B0T21DRAFT_369936 [Apiosordaria backusii]